MLLRLLSISLLPALIAGQEFQCGTDKIQSDIAKTVVQFNCKDKVADINKCCISHDGCYDQQQPRGTCDASFCTCVQAASAGNPLCGFYTSLFCDTAKVFGEAAYKKVGEEAKKRRETKEAEQRAAAAAAAAAAMNERQRKDDAAVAEMLQKLNKPTAKAATTLVASAPEPAAAAVAATPTTVAAPQLAAAAAPTTTAAPTTAKSEPKKDTVKLTITKREPIKKEEAKVEQPAKEEKKAEAKKEEVKIEEPKKVEEPKVEAKKEEKIQEVKEKKDAGESRHKEEKLPGEKRAQPSSPEQTSSEEDAEVADLEARLAREEADLERAEAEQRRVLAALAARKAALRAELRAFREAQRALWHAREEAAASSDDEETVVAPATTTVSSKTTIDPVLQASRTRKRMEIKARHALMQKKAEERMARIQAAKTLKLDPTSTTTVAPPKIDQEPKVTVTNELLEGSGSEVTAGEAKGSGAANATAADAAPTPLPASTPAAYAPVPGGQSASEAVAAAEAAAAAQAAAYRAAKRVTPSPLQFTPFPDPMEKLREMMAPRTRAPPAPVTPDPVEIERQRVQSLARAAFERTLEETKRVNEQLRLRDHQMEEIAAAKMRAMAEMNHPIDNQLALTPEQEARIAEQVKLALRKSFAKPELKKLEPGRENAFSQDDDYDVQQKASTNIRRSPPSSTPSPSTPAQPSLVAPPTTFDNLFHNVPSNSEPQPFAEVKTPSDTTIFHQKHQTTLPVDDPSASVFHRKDPLPITQFLEDHEAIDTLSSIDVGGAKEEVASHHLREGFTPVTEEAGPFESLLQEAQEHLKQSQQRVDQLIKDQRLKIEREERERKRLLEERRLKLAEQRRLLEERKKRREEKRKERLARQRLLADRANQKEWSRRLDQEAKVKALEDSTRVPDNSLEDDSPTTTKRSHRKKHRTTTTVEPEDEEEDTASAEATTAKSRRKHSRHAKNELDSDSYEAYEQWLRWREKRKLARRKLAAESEAEE